MPLKLTHRPSTLDTALVPCGGLGTRMRPVTEWVPKELLPVALRPLLHWTLDEAARAGLARAIVITNPDKPSVADAARAWRGPLEVEVVPQPAPRGLGDALRRARERLDGAPFAVLLPDNLFACDGPSPTDEVLALARATALASVVLARVAAVDAGTKGPTGRARVRETDDGSLRVTAIADKGGARFDTGGAADALTPIGRMALPGDVFAEFDAVAAGLAPGAELDDVPVLQRLAARDALAGVVTSARFYDVGLPEGYRQAVSDFPPRL
jgi:UTP--glucose-1-phosphate uridylyltransferase